MSLFARLLFVALPLALAYALFTAKVGLAEAVFAALAVTYAEVAIKVDEWSTLSILGRKSETPQLFMSNEIRYHRARIFLLIAAVIALFFTHTTSWYVGMAGLAAAWFTTPWIGRNLAFAHIRRIGREMVEELNSLKASNPAEYAREVAEGGPASHLTEWEKEVRVSNHELSERLKKCRHMGV